MNHQIIPHKLDYCDCMTFSFDPGNLSKPNTFSEMTDVIMVIENMEVRMVV